MNNKNGFTLIELLAVIVILAIIAVIATPIILGVIDDAKKSAANDSAYGTLDAIKNYYATSQLTTNPVTLPLSIDMTNLPSGLNISGTKPTAGTIVLGVDGNYTVSGLVINGYTCTYTREANSFSCV